MDNYFTTIALLKQPLAALLFGEEPVREQEIPRIINDYNHCMNGVDIADQLRSNYSTEVTHRCCWPA